MLAVVSALLMPLAAVVSVSAQDTSGRGPSDSLAAHNRSVFEQLFGGANAPAPRRDTVEIARIGAAADHPDRSHKAIHDVVFTHLQATGALYRQRLLVKPGLKGEMMVVFRINADGTVDNVKVASSSVDDTGLEENLILAVATWRFLPIPDEAGSVTVAYPFRFLPE